MEKVELLRIWEIAASAFLYDTNKFMKLKTQEFEGVEIDEYQIEECCWENAWETMTNLDGDDIYENITNVYKEIVNFCEQLKSK